MIRPQPGYPLNKTGLALAAAVMGCLSRCHNPSPPPRTLEGLAGMLGDTVGGVVDPDDIVWEPSPGFWAELLWGRRAWFLAAPRGGQPRDVYRARVRLTPEGAPIAVRASRNLTRTPAGDDMALELNDRHAVFATVAYGQVQGITVLDLDGLRDSDRPEKLLDRLLLSINSYQETATLSGIGRTDIVMDVPLKAAKLRLTPPQLRIDVADAPRALVYNIEERTLAAAEGGQPYGAHAVPQHYGNKPLVLWAVDTLRAELGPDAIAWLENVVFGAKDAVKRSAYALVTSPRESVLKETPSLLLPPMLDAQHLDSDVSGWPPSTIPSLWEQPKPGEGEWRAVDLPFLKRTLTSPGTQAPPYFYQTTIRPDAKRPYSEVIFIAMDMRQLELAMQAGYEDPKAATGPGGTGRLPRDQDTLNRVVATFNGAFKSEHGQYGMMVERRVIVPPVRDAATVILDTGGKSGLGNWPRVDTIPPNIVSFRQNLDPLLEDGVINPAGRYVWGWQLAGTSVMTQRTALCVTPAGHLYYAFGEEIDAPTLSRALKQAGCSYGIHLDMNPHHCGFVFADIVDVRAERYHLKVADRRMEINADRFVRWSPKDFFYVMLRDPRPPSTGGYHWEPDGGTEPSPAFLPAIFSSKLVLGGLEVELLSFDPDRVAWRIRAGSLEPAPPDAPPRILDLSGEDQHRVLAAIGLGHTTGATGYGLAFGPAASLPLRSSYATLVAHNAAGIELLTPGEPVGVTSGDEALQLPLLAKDGELVAAGRATGALRPRGALCVAPDGRVLIARAKHDSSMPLAAALLRAGCTRAAELDRGSQHPSFVHRVGSSTPPTGRYETSVLYALGRPMAPHAYRWKPPGSVSSVKPAAAPFFKAKASPSGQAARANRSQPEGR